MSKRSDKRELFHYKLQSKTKKKHFKKRMDRVKRQSEIAELAAGENKDQNEIKLRANFQV